MKIIEPKNLKEWKKKLKTAWNIAKQSEIKAIKLRVVSNNKQDKSTAKAILIATDGIIYYKVEVPLKSSTVNGVFYLDLDKNKEKEKEERLENKIKRLKGEKIVKSNRYFDIEPYLINVDFPILKVDNPTNYFMAEKNKLLEGLNLMAINSGYTDLKLLNKKAILVSKIDELKHKYKLPILQQNKNYGRLFFNPSLLKKIIENVSQEIVAIWFNKELIKVGDCFLANIIKPRY